MRYSTPLNFHLIKKYQPSKLNVWKKTFVLVVKRRFFSNVQLWRLVFLNSVGVQRRTVSHFKGLFKTFKMRYSTFPYSYWIGLHVHFNKAILHLKRANMPFFLSPTVYGYHPKIWLEVQLSIHFKNLEKKNWDFQHNFGKKWHRTAIVSP